MAGSTTGVPSVIRTLRLFRRFAAGCVRPAWEAPDGPIGSTVRMSLRSPVARAPASRSEGSPSQTGDRKTDHNDIRLRVAGHWARPARRCYVQRPPGLLEHAVPQNRLAVGSTV